MRQIQMTNRHGLNLESTKLGPFSLMYRVYLIILKANIFKFILINSFIILLPILHFYNFYFVLSQLKFSATNTIISVWMPQNPLLIGIFFVR